MRDKNKEGLSASLEIMMLRVVDIGDQFACPEDKARYYEFISKEVLGRLEEFAAAKLNNEVLEE